MTPYRRSVALATAHSSIAFAASFAFTSVSASPVSHGIPEAPGLPSQSSSPHVGVPPWGDEDCDGKPGDSGMPCDQGLVLADVNAMDAAKAIELCAQATATDRRYGVISAAYVRADGTPFA